MKRTKMKTQTGFVRWFDALGDDGILTDINTGDEYYFNSWSFPKTHYRVRGKCKRTRRMKTIRTRMFPGLFIERKHIQDPVCKKVGTDTPITFRQADGVRQRWAVDIVVDRKKKSVRRVLYYHLTECFKSLQTETEPVWWRYLDIRICKLLWELVK